MHKEVILLFCGIIYMNAQSEINASGGSASNNFITMEWNVTHGFQELYMTSFEIVKLGTLQPFIKEKTTEDSPSIYNFVTANGDGKNDFFSIEGLQGYKSHDLSIFNRLGHVVFHTNDYKNDWNGDGLEPGTYFYTFKYDNSESKNSIFLSR